MHGYLNRRGFARALLFRTQRGSEGVSLSHRILLVGDDPRPLAPLEASLRRHGQSVLVATDAQQAAALARQFQPSALVLWTALTEPSGRDALAVLFMHPATAALPVVVVTEPPSVDAAIAAFQSGVSELVAHPVTPVELIARLDAALGSAHDTARRAAAIDRRGGALLRRIGAYLQGNACTGLLHVDAAGDPATLPFAGGELGETRYGDLKGDGALRALLSHPGEAPWTLRFVDEGSSLAGSPAGSGEFGLDSSDGGILELADVAEEILDDAEVPLRVLLVDDDPSLLELYGKFFERAGFEVLVEENGRSGYGTAQKQRPDVVVSDIMMPEMDGWGFLTLVRDDYRLRETPFLLLSCHHDFVEKLRFLEAGADDYLEKGLRGDAIVARVNAAVAPRRRMLAGLDPSAPFRGTLARVGIQSLLEALGEKRATGTLLVDDGLALYAVGLLDGRVVASTATANEQRDGGNEALLSLLTLDDAPFSFDPSQVPPETEGPRFGDMRDALCGELNAARDRRREQMLSDASSLVFHSHMLAFYRMVCPDVVRRIVDALAPGTPPREVMAAGLASPVLVEWVVKDVLRKRVARFADEPQK